MFLYILKLPKYNCIKIGVASSDERIVQHIKNYSNIDLENSYKITSSDKSTLKILEKQLLNDYIEYSKYIPSLYQIDGYTEIRDASILEDLISDIELKKNKFPKKELNIIKGITLDFRKAHKKKVKAVPIFGKDTLRIPKSIICNANVSMYKSGNMDTLNDYDLSILISILNMYKHNDQHEIMFYYKDLIEFLGYSDRNGQLKRKIAKCLIKMNKLSINIDGVNCRILEKITTENNLTKIQINETLLEGLKDNNHIIVNKDLYFKCSRCISRRMILILEYHKLLNTKLEYEYLYGLIPLLDKTDYYNKRRLLESIVELKDYGFISSYEKSKKHIEIFK